MESDSAHSDLMDMIKQIFLLHKQRKKRQANELTDKLQNKLTQSISANKIDTYSAALCQASIYRARGWFTKAIQAMKQTIEKSDHKPDTLFDLYLIINEMHYSSGDNEACLEFNEKAIALKPFESKPYQNKAMCLINLMRFNEALPAIQMAIENSKTPDAFHYALKGQVCMDLRNWKAAKNNFEKAIATNPGHERAYYLLGDLYLRWNRKKEALEAFNKALSINPDDKDSLLNRGYMNVELNQDLEQAIQDFDRLIKLDPSFMKSYYYKALTLLELDRTDEARELTDKILRIDPDNKNAQKLKKEIS